MSVLQRDGFDFSFDPDACRDCPGYCCYGESGKIWVNQQEIEQISSFLHKSIVSIIESYLERKDNRLSIRERFTALGFECVFFDNKKRQCSIYEVRPGQCRCFPFWEHFRKNREGLKECPGIIDLQDRS